MTVLPSAATATPLGFVRPVMDPHSSIADAGLTSVIDGTLVKVVAW